MPDSINSNNQIIDFNGKPLTITNHAVDRLIERWERNKETDVPKRPLETITKLLRSANQEQLDESHRVRRLINHGEIAEYWVDQSKQWRFVIVKRLGKYTLVTIEKSYY